MRPRAELGKQPLERICFSVDSFGDEQDRLALPALLERRRSKES